MRFLAWLQRSPLVVGTYAANLFVSFHFFFVIYINSSFITQFVTESEVGYLYIIGSVASTAVFVAFIWFLRRLGNVRFISLLILLEILALLGLIFAQDALPLLLASFLLHLVVSPVIYLNLDIFLEQSIKNERITGTARGLFLTMINIAQVLSPLVVGFLVAHEEYWRAYLASIFFLLLALGVVLVRLRHFTDEDYTHRTLRGMKKRFLENRALYNAFAAQFLLRFFYAWMVIYMPLYLFRYIGLPWSEIGIIFTIMLLPFLLLELPLGRIADVLLGEKEMLIAGFLILGVTVALIPFLTAASLVLWAALLFCTRVGASFVEVGSESHFFKHVNGKHATTISMFRLARPAAYVLAAGVASVALLVISVQWSFMLLALILFWGLRYALALTDTK